MGLYGKKLQQRNQLLLLSVFGDAIFAYLGMALGFYIRFRTEVKHLGVEVEDPEFSTYQSILIVGVLFLLFTFARLGLYNWKLLLRPARLNLLIIKATTFWFAVYLGFSLFVKFEPPISRIFMLSSMLSVALCTMTWRYSFFRLLMASHLSTKLVRSVVIVGWNMEAERVSQAIYRDPRHPYSILGVVETNLQASYRSGDGIYPALGTIKDIRSILEKHQPDIVVIADLDMSKEQIVEINHAAELHLTEVKIVPSMFQIFISGLQLETISGLPILGVEELSCNRMFNQALRRTYDIVGACVGLFLSAPVMLVMALMIKRQDPGPIFFAQERIGMNKRPFRMLKLRSMRQGSDKFDHLNQSTLRADPRVLPIGSFMRRWNLDELPQFWNVLRGDMSLVGPRPERTFHAHKLADEIIHYNARHVVKPGLTGWAQVNGLRGDTSLEERVRYDLYYIENWSVWLDFYIMFLTFVKRDNAY